MDRREAIRKGLWSVSLIPFLGRAHPHIEEGPTNKTKYCKHCSKEVAWAETTLMETTAKNFQSSNRSYEPVGIVIFHADGTKCAEETVVFKRLDNPIIHKDYQWAD